MALTKAWLLKHDFPFHGSDTYPNPYPPCHGTPLIILLTEMCVWVSGSYWTIRAKRFADFAPRESFQRLFLTLRDYFDFARFFWRPPKIPPKDKHKLKISQVIWTLQPLCCLGGSLSPALCVAHLRSEATHPQLVRRNAFCWLLSEKSSRP